MSDYERSLSKELCIPSCDWNQPACDTAWKGWEPNLPEYADLFYSFSNDVLSSDGKVAWGVLHYSDSFTSGVLVQLDTKAKGLKEFVRERNAEAAVTQDDVIRHSDEEDATALTKEFQTFIVVECKAPCIHYTEEVLKQGMGYAKKRNASFLVLTNGDWRYCHWKSPDGKWIAVDDIPDYAEAVSGKFALTRADPEPPHLLVPPSAESALFHARSRNSIGSDTPPDLWPMLLRIEDFLVSSPVMSKISISAPAGLKFIEDWGPYWHEVGNPSGGKWPGKYRTFLLQDTFGKQFMFGVSLLSMQKAVEHPRYGNRNSTTVLIGALSFDSGYHPGIQYAICRSMTKHTDLWEFSHDGRFTVGKGAGMKANLISFLRTQAPELLRNNEVFLGALPDRHLEWEDMTDFLSRFAAYTWLRHSFKEQLRSGRKEKAEFRF